MTRKWSSESSLIVWILKVIGQFLSKRKRLSQVIQKLNIKAIALKKISERSMLQTATAAHRRTGSDWQRLLGIFWWANIRSIAYGNHLIPHHQNRSKVENVFRSNLTFYWPDSGHLYAIFQPCRLWIPIQR